MFAVLRDVQVEQDRLNEEASNLKAGMAELKKVCLVDHLTVLVWQLP